MGLRDSCTRGASQALHGEFAGASTFAPNAFDGHVSLRRDPRLPVERGLQPPRCQRFIPRDPPYGESVAGEQLVSRHMFGWMRTAVGIAGLVLLIALPCAGQPTAAPPRVVLDAPADPASAPDLGDLPAAWRVRLALPIGDEPDEHLLRAAFDERAAPGAVWLTLSLDGLVESDVPPLVSAVRVLVSARPRIRVVEPLVATMDQRLAAFVVRQLAVELKAVREDVAIALSTPAERSDEERGAPPAAASLPDASLLPLLDIVVVPDSGAAPAVRAALDAQGVWARLAVLDQSLERDEPARALSDREIAALAGPVDIRGYVAADEDLPALVRAIRTLERVLGDELTTVAADLRVGANGQDVTTAWSSRTLFGVESLGAYVQVDVPADASLDAEFSLVLPLAGGVVLLDPARGTEHPVATERDDATQTTSVAITFPSPGRWLVDVNREADTSFVQRQDVTAARALTLEEILARHQMRQAAERVTAPRYIADVTLQQYFRPTVTDPGFDVYTENRFYVSDDGVEWEELTFAVNGARWGADRPPFPLLQPEKVLSPPLAIELDQRYRYRLAGRERVDGVECYVVRFDPIDTSESLYRGTVWIAADTFARVKQQAVQTNLSAPVVSNDETQWFAPVRTADGRTVHLPARSYNQQLVLIAGRNLLVERHMAFSGYDVNPADFVARRQAARQSDRIMYRETDQGARYFVKEGDTRVVSDVATTYAKAQAFGVTIDPAYAFPLPIFGINYLNFEFLGRKDTQLALLFGGVLAAGNVQRPRVIGRRVDLNVDFFAIAAPGSDRFYLPDGEREEARVLTWPLSTGVNLGFQATSHQKVSAQYQFRFDGYVRDRTTAEDYTTPSSTVSNGFGVLYEYRRAGYSITANAVWARRASWRPWGEAGDLQATAPSFERYVVNGTKTFYVGPFSRIVFNGAWFTGRRLDRFGQYQFGLFDETRLRGVPSAGVRYGELAMGRAQYSFNVFEQYRLDLFLDRAWGRTREIGVPWEGITGIGAAVNMRIPGRNLILRTDVGKSFLPDRYGSLGSTVVQVLLLRPLP
jgi:hypothetical protein